MANEYSFIIQNSLNILYFEKIVFSIREINVVKGWKILITIYQICSSSLRYTRVNSGSYAGSVSKTTIHAVLDYDDDNFEDYYDEENSGIPIDVHVTPIQGPILLKNGSVPVVPLYAYPQLNNGTLVQIPVSTQLIYLIKL